MAKQQKITQISAEELTPELMEFLKSQNVPLTRNLDGSITVQGLNDISNAGQTPGRVIELGPDYVPPVSFIDPSSAVSYIPPSAAKKPSASKLQQFKMSPEQEQNLLDATDFVEKGRSPDLNDSAFFYSKLRPAELLDHLRMYSDKPEIVNIIKQEIERRKKKQIKRPGKAPLTEI